MEDIKIKVSLDLSGVDRALKDMDTRVKQSTRGVEEVGSKGTSVFSRLKTTLSEVGSRAGKLGTDLNGVGAKGSSSGRQVDSSFKSVSSSLGRATKAAAGLVAGLIAIGGAKSIIDGVVNRVDAIHGGKKTMTILFDGDTKRAEKAVNMVKDKVQGTPFTLNFGVGEMTKLVASGMDEVKASKVFEVSMDVSAVFDPGNVEGTAAEINDIFTKVAAKGSMDMTHLDSLNTRGIPTLKLLAEHYGVSEEAARKMVKEGKVGFNDLADALSVYEGSAKSAGDSISGMLGNIKTAIINAFSTPLMDDARYQEVVDGLGSVLSWVKGPLSEGISNGMLGAFDFVQRAMPTVKAGLSAIKNLFNEFKDIVMGVWDSVAEHFGAGDLSGLEQLKVLFEWISDNAETVAGLITGVVAAFIAWKTAVGLFNIIMTAYEVIMGIAAITTGLFNAALWANPITWVVVGILALIAAIVALVVYWEEVSAFFSNLWESIKETASNVWTAIKDFFSELWTAITEHMVAEWEAFKELLSTVWESIISTASAIWEGLKTFFSELWSSIKETASSIWEGLTSFFSSVWQGIVNTATDIWNGLMNFLSNLWNSIVSTGQSIWNSFIGFFIGLWSTIKTTFNSVWDGLKTYLSNTWESIKSTATSVWTNVKDAMLKPIQDAKTKMLEIVENIKSAFNNMKIKIPKPKLPRVDIKTAHKNIAGVNIPYPSFSVDWFATGGIATGPSIVGIGEAGSEAILPLSNKAKMKPFAHAVAAMMPNNDSDGGDTYITINATVREEADARRIAEEIEKEKQRKRRFKGGK